MYTGKLIFAAALAAVIATVDPQAQECLKGLEQTTHIYAIKGDTLRLDVLTDPTLEIKGPRPVLLFASGGGFEFQNRATASSDVHCVMPYFARKGYVAVSADYRCDYARAKAAGEIPNRWIGDLEVNGGLEEDGIWQAIDRAVKISIEDLFDATTFIIDHADEWQIDTKRISAMGSSASAIAFLTAENLICCDSAIVKEHLPEGFNYASIIPCAGGVWKSSTLPKVDWGGRVPCPMMIFHGDIDNIVPYHTRMIPEQGGALYGVADMVADLDSIGATYAYWLYHNDDHEVASHPMMYNAPDMLRFIIRAVDRGEKFTVRHTETWESKQPSKQPE